MNDEEELDAVWHSLSLAAKRSWVAAMQPRADDAPTSWIEDWRRPETDDEREFREGWDSL